MVTAYDRSRELHFTAVDNFYFHANVLAIKSWLITLNPKNITISEPDARVSKENNSFSGFPVIITFTALTIGITVVKRSRASLK